MLLKPASNVKKENKKSKNLLQKKKKLFNKQLKNQRKIQLNC